MTNVAILGAGNIARTMARTLTRMEERGDAVCLYAVASRSGEKAEAFAREYGAQKAYGSYEALAQDPAVELVYVATPHAFHAQQMELCLQGGKAVLSEKAFTANAAQAERILALAREKGLLAAEAIWTRYVPMRRILCDLLEAGEIGTPRALTANLGYDVQGKERIRRPELAGGALLDLGVYALNFAAMVFGTEVARVDSSAQLLDTGVDLQEQITLHYADGRMACLMATAACRTSRNAWIYGDKGCIQVDNINNPLRLAVYDDPCDLSGGPRRVLEAPRQITGFEYEVEACLRALRAGRSQCEEMPHGEILRMMRWMDALRGAWGVRFPFE